MGILCASSIKSGDSRIVYTYRTRTFKKDPTLGENKIKEQNMPQSPWSKAK